MRIGAPLAAALALATAAVAPALTIEYSLDRADELLDVRRAAVPRRARGCRNVLSHLARAEHRCPHQGRCGPCDRRCARGQWVLPSRDQRISRRRRAADALGRAVCRDASEQRSGQAVRGGARDRRGVRAREDRARQDRGRPLRGEDARMGRASHRGNPGSGARGALADRARGSRGRRHRRRRAGARQSARLGRGPRPLAARDLRAQSVGGSVARYDREPVDRARARVERQLRRCLRDPGAFLCDHAPVSRGHRATATRRRDRARSLFGACRARPEPAAREQDRRSSTASRARLSRRSVQRAARQHAAAPRQLRQFRPLAACGQTQLRRARMRRTTLARCCACTRTRPPCSSRTCSSSSTARSRRTASATGSSSRSP